MNLSNSELDLYSRQIVLPNFGKMGQSMFKKEKIAILGCGGLGSNTALLFAKMGVGYMRIIDRDKVELSNLPRTPIFSKSDVGKNKAVIAKKNIEKLEVDTEIDSIVTTIDSSSIGELLDDINIVIDGLDSIDTRLIVNSWCQENRIPFLFAGVLGYSANISTFAYTSDDTPCLACLFSGDNYSSMPGNEEAGIHPTVISIAVAVQASELTRILTGQAPLLNGKLLIYDQLSLSQDIIEFKKNPKCRTCAARH